MSTTRDDAALTGPFGVMPLEELLQWLDQTGRAGVIFVMRQDGFESWLAVKDRELAYASPPVLEGALRGGTPAERSAAALEGVLDLFAVSAGRFRFEARAPLPEDALPIGQPLGFLAMEGLRLRDEWPRLDSAFPNEAASLRANGSVQTGNAVHDAILARARAGGKLGDARLKLGLSRPAMLRRVGELVDRGLLAVEGTPERVDPIAVMLAQAATLLGEGQYAEAAHVFRTLLASDPLDSRARELLMRTEQIEARALARALPQRAMLKRKKTGSLPGHAGAVLDLVADGRPVAFVLLASPLREVETLRIIAQLAKSQHLGVELPTTPHARPRAPKGAV
jgi:hypothetical protein